MLFPSAQSLTIIAEASGNHGQDLSRALALVKTAAQVGADIVKFQTYTPETIAAEGVVIPRGHNAAHDAWLDRMEAMTLRDLLRHGGLPRAWHQDLKQCADDHGIEFLSTPFSVDAAKFLVEEIGVKRIKIASGDLTFTPLLAYANSTTLPILLSTGGATRQEIETAVHGALWAAYLHGRLTLLHCRSIYPCPPALANLASLRVLQENFPQADVGWSDHTTDPEVVPVMAAMLGATVIEKHFTLRDDWEAPETVDAGHSLYPWAFERMVQTLRQVPAILGDETKTPHPLEAHDRLWARRSPDDFLRPTQEAREGRWE